MPTPEQRKKVVDAIKAAIGAYVTELEADLKDPVFKGNEDQAFLSSEVSRAKRFLYPFGE
jgi:hypothetical protein